HVFQRDKQKRCDPVETVVFFFRRLTDRENFHRVTDQLVDSEVERVGQALGWLNMFNPFRPDGHYLLDLSHPDEKRLASAVMELARVPMELGRVSLERAFLAGTFSGTCAAVSPARFW
ncbi:unnamed protein product, partial [Laminaria digitata]